MSIIERIKKLLSTPEARHLKEEVVGTASDLASKTKEVATDAFVTGKEVASDLTDRARDTIAEMRDKEEDENDGKIDYDTFKQIEVKVGTILSVEKIEKSDKLLKLMVNVGEDEPRQIVSGIATYFKDIQSLTGRQAMFVTNLAPRKIFGLESNGMIFAVNDENAFSILEPDTPIEPGTQAS